MRGEAVSSAGEKAGQSRKGSGGTDHSSCVGWSRFPDCFRRWARLCGFPLCEAIKAAGLNQLRSLGVRDRGEIAPGQRADLVLLDAEGGLRATVAKTDGTLLPPAIARA